MTNHYQDQRDAEDHATRQIPIPPFLAAKPAKPPRVMLSDMDWIKVHKHLTEALDVVTVEPPVVRYLTDWSDKRIADEVGGTATEANVAYRREKHFGKLPPKVTTVGAGGPDPRVDKLREDHETLFNEVVMQDGLIQGLTQQVAGLNNDIDEMVELQAAMQSSISVQRETLKGLGQATTITDIAELKDRFNRLIAALKMNHTIDARNLMFEEK